MLGKRSRRIEDKKRKMDAARARRRKRREARMAEDPVTIPTATIVKPKSSFRASEWVQTDKTNAAPPKASRSDRFDKNMWSEQ